MKQHLSASNNDLIKIQTDYALFGYPPVSSWRDVSTQLENFRGDSDYVWEKRLFGEKIDEKLISYFEYVKQNDSMNLLEYCKEDCAYGAYGVEKDGVILSRDLLDSVNEINWLFKHVNQMNDDSAVVLDIGAGYGRIAHRISERFGEKVKTICADAVAESTFISKFYLDFRKAAGSRVIELQEAVSELHLLRPTVAINIHSFSEMPMESIAWWIDRIGETDISSLVIVTNEENESLLSCERDLGRVDFLPYLEKNGWCIKIQEPVVLDKTTRTECGINNWFTLLEKTKYE